jgi:hypothetical protein
MKPLFFEPKARQFGHKSITALHVSLVVLGAFFVAVLFIVGFPGGRLFLEENFVAIRAVSYIAWGIGLGAFIAAPTLLVKDFGVRTSAKMRAIHEAVLETGGRPLFRAFSVASALNVVVLALSPLGLFLGDEYTWDIFRAHLVLSTLVVAFASLTALVRLRSLLDELAAVPLPSRVSHAGPAGF